MAYGILLYVLEDHLHKVIEELTDGKEKFAEFHKIPFEDKWLVSVKMKGMTHATGAFINMEARGIPFNALGSYGSKVMTSLRFNHVGEAIMQFGLDNTELAVSTREYLTYMTWPDGARPQVAEDRATVITMRSNWEDQAAYGRRAAMLQLLGK